MGAQPHHVLAVMQDALRRLSQFPVSSPEWKVWTQSCGRSVSHHSGPHCAAAALNLVGRAQGCYEGCYEEVKLSGSGAARPLSSGPVVLAKVRRHMNASAKLAKVTAPRNITEWKGKCAKVVKGLG